MIIHGADEMTNEHDMIWANRPPSQLHACLVRSPIPLAIIALHTGSYQVFPSICTAARFGKNVVDRQHWLEPTAVLASMAIAAQYVLARKDDLLVRNADED